MKQFDVITLFPEMFTALQSGITGRAIERALIAVNYWNPRDYTTDIHRTVDDKAYGGGPGMVMKMEPLRDAIKAAKAATSTPATVVYLTPQGKVLEQQHIQRMATDNKRLIFVAGRYEGIDERLIDTEIDEEWSIGDYVLTGGELAAMVVIDAITRLLPGALGDENSAKEDSFVAGLLDYPHYTRPEKIGDLSVPDILLSGNHEQIAKWRFQQSLGRTWLRRPELLGKRGLTYEEQKLLDEFIEQMGVNET